jgi:hypothetical protein
LHVEDRHDDRSKGFDTLIDASGQPSGPTSLGCTRDDERLDTRNVESVSELLNCVPVKKVVNICLNGVVEQLTSHGRRIWFEGIATATSQEC